MIYWISIHEEAKQDDISHIFGPKVMHHTAFVYA
jgi:hypothetical protein